MGVEIVKAAVVYGKRLSGNAYKVLVAMSLSALDKPSNGRPANLYWGGWDALAIALGYENADRNSSGHTIVKRAVKELREARHITPMNDARRGFAQTYMVHPGGVNKGEQNVPARREQFVPAKGEQNVPQRGNNLFPPRTHKDSEGLSEDISPTSGTEVQTAPEPKSATRSGHKFEGIPGTDCLVCDGSYLDRARHPLRLLRGA